MRMTVTDPLLVSDFHNNMAHADDDDAPAGGVMRRVCPGSPWWEQCKVDWMVVVTV